MHHFSNIALTKASSMCSRVNMWFALILLMVHPTLTVLLRLGPSLPSTGRYDCIYLIDLQKYIAEMIAVFTVHRQRAVWEGCSTTWQNHSGCWICTIRQCHHDCPLHWSGSQLLHVRSSESVLIYIHSYPL